MSRSSMARLAEERKVEVVRAAPPWTGFLQDANTTFYSGGTAFGNTELYGPAGATDTLDLIGRNEALTWDYGWKRMQGSTGAKALPLGGASSNFPLTAIGAACNEIGALAYLPPVVNVTSTGASAEANVAITVSGTNGDGYVYYLNIAGGDWAAAAPAFGAALDISTDETRRIDTAVYPLAGNPTTGNRQSTLIFTNGVGTGGLVWYYPSNQDGTQFDVLPYTTATPFINLNNFQAESVCVADESVFFLGTSENSVSYPQRIRWTSPAWTSIVNTSIWNNQVDGGAGGLDFVEFAGKGLRVLPQGQRIVAYFEDGVAILQPTGRTLPRYTRSYITKNRGLIGKGAVIDLGNGVHFGIFTDGMYFFSEGGQWQEAGITGDGGGHYHKWKDHFFALLDHTQANRITLGYDPQRDLIYISFPVLNSSGVPLYTWTYERANDRMWPTNYTLAGNDGGTAQYAYAWGWLRSTEGVATSRLALAHGSGNGFVWEHVPNLATRDGTTVGWRYRSSAYDYGDPYSLKTLLADRIDFNSHATTGSFSRYSLIDGKDNSNIFTYASGDVTYPSVVSQRAILHVPVHGTAKSIKHHIEGTHPFTIFGMQHEFVKTGDAL